MIRVENEVAIAARPEAVWDVLMDFEGYPRWHPFIRFTGTAVLGGEVEYFYTSKLPGMRRFRKMRAFAGITALEAPSDFAWRIDMGSFFFRVDEIYHLERHPTGTRLAHRTEYRGLVALLAPAGLASRAYTTMCQADAALRAHFAKRPPPPAPPRKPRKWGRR